MPDLAPAFAHIDAFVEQRMRADNTPGLALALTDRDRLLHVATYGFADLAARTPATPDTLWEIGSIGKSFTAVALLQLHDAGELDLHAPVTRYLPWFEVGSQSDHAPITIHHLLTQTAGITAGLDATPDAQSEVWALRYTETGGPPGERFHYSNVGYKILGLVLSHITGETYPDFIQRRILDPLGMTATAPAIIHDTRRRMAVGHTSLYNDRPWHASHPLVPAALIETDTGDGSIAATAADMATYARMLLNRGRGPDGPILSDDAFDRFTQRAMPAWGNVFYGYGLLLEERDGHATVGHTGGMIGSAAHLLVDLDGGLGVAVFVNGPGSPWSVASFAIPVLRAALGGSDLPPLPAASRPTIVEGAADYAGSYTAPATGDALVFAAEDNRLLLALGTDAIALEPWDDDVFFAPHPAFDRFPLTFGRDEGGAVVEVWHGPAWYVAAAYTGPTTFDVPAEWHAYPGHYRSHNPWVPTFRVVLRKDRLWLMIPSEPDGFEADQPLVPLAPGRFRVDDDPAAPERLRFDAIVDGHALRANLSGADYFRFFTP